MDRYKYIGCAQISISSSEVFATIDENLKACQSIHGVPTKEKRNVMHAVTTKEALRISMNWEVASASVEIPAWSKSIEKKFEGLDPEIKHYLDVKAPKCISEVSWALPAIAGLVNPRAIYYLAFSNDGRYGCRFWGGASAEFATGRGFAILDAGSQRMRNKGQDWMQHMKFQHQELSHALQARHGITLPTGDSVMGARKALGTRSWSAVADALVGSKTCRLGDFLGQGATAIQKFYNVWFVPGRLSTLWETLQGPTPTVAAE